MTPIEGINPSAQPSGTGCADCEAAGGWWLHLRRCTACGQIGCCDSSPAQHASAHAAATGHPIVRSFEPGEEWFWNYRTESYVEQGPELSPPLSRPVEQTVPGPSDRVPAEWREQLH
jgi:hypothetical protein